MANNSSGMCCGVKQNTYHTLQDMRVVLVDGTILDTADAASRAAFHESHAALLEGVAALASRVQADPPLMELIHKKYSIKNTTGYSINALADFPPSDPIEILKRLMIGSEGTLGFVSRVTYQARRMRTACAPHAHRMHTCEQEIVRMDMAAARPPPKKGGAKDEPSKPVNLELSRAKGMSSQEFGVAMQC